MTDYKGILCEEYGYTEYEAEVTEIDIENMDEESKRILDMAVIDKKEAGGYSYRDFSVEKLEKEYGLDRVAAILSISMLKSDYELFSEILNRGSK